MPEEKFGSAGRSTLEEFVSVKGSIVSLNFLALLPAPSHHLFKMPLLCLTYY